MQPVSNRLAVACAVSCACLHVLACTLCNSVDLRLVEKVVQGMQHTHGTPNGSPAGPNIVSLNPFSIEDVLQDALRVGDALGLRPQAEAAVAALQARVDAALAFVAQQQPLAHPVVAFLEWFEPLFPGGHWTPQLIHMAGEAAACQAAAATWGKCLVCSPCAQFPKSACA